MEQFQIPSGWNHWISRIVLLSLTLIVSPIGWTQSSNTDIHKVDFKNFSYPWLDPHGWPIHLQWINPALKSKIHLVNGRWDQRDESGNAESQGFVGLTFEDINYASFSADSAESAIVVLKYDSGGPPYHYWVYIYGFANGEPSLMGFFHAGDRAYNGLYRVFEKDHLLNVELFDPDLKEGECCSTGYIHYEYRWNGAEFEETGKPRKGMIDASAKRPFSIFGLPLPIGHK
jgi:hypothetical protein